ncbi:MAG: histidine kinase [Eubacterium sp.]|nr:histidine kinase [Eubacterium sp.]
MILGVEQFLLIALDASLVLQLFGLWIAVMLDDYINTRRRRLLLVIIGVVFVLVIQGHLDWYIPRDPSYTWVHKLISALGYALRPAVIAILIQIQKISKHTKLLWTIIGLNALVHFSTFFSDICFTFTEDGSFSRGPLGYTSFFVSGILLAYLVVEGFMLFHMERKGDYVVPIFVSVFIIFATVSDVALSVSSPVSFLMVSMVVACVFYYIWLHMAYIREHEKDMEAGQRIKIMMSQIQPHFLFNTLATVQALCHTDPDMASDTLEKFGIYLRQNIDSLDKPDLIPFEKELEHTQVYAEIEKVRFPSIEIRYDIEDMDFDLPALTIQPLVENAIRHGVRIREHGLIEVEVRKKRYGHRIVIRDNGKGFDINAPQSPDRSHIGMHNVSDRIESMCRGDMKVESKVGEGTTITIRLPYDDTELK